MLTCALEKVAFNDAVHLIVGYFFIAVRSVWCLRFIVRSWGVVRSARGLLGAVHVADVGHHICAAACGAVHSYVEFQGKESF